MIPRFKPTLGRRELAPLCGTQEPVPEFERAFAQAFEARAAIAFPYGRSALWAFFKALGIEDAEVVMPAYTCSVVAHAVVLSGNIPRFVDITMRDFNMNLDQLEEKITERTRVIIPTHLFGYPADVDRIEEMARDASERYGNRIWIVQDCAHAFGAHWRGRPVYDSGDATLFALGISKTITSIFGGMLTFNDPSLASRVADWRDARFRASGAWRSFRSWVYLMAVSAAFNERLYGAVRWLEEKTSCLDRYTKAYHLDGIIDFPPDSERRMARAEARVGLAQLQRYEEIVRARRDLAHRYRQALEGVEGLELPPLVEGATYSHFVARAADRDKWMVAGLRSGVQFGRLIDYSIPHMSAYRSYANDEPFPHSLHASKTAINLPLYAGMSREKQDGIIRLVRRISESEPQRRDSGRPRKYAEMTKRRKCIA